MVKQKKRATVSVALFFAHRVHVHEIDAPNLPQLYSFAGRCEIGDFPILKGKIP
jgi:hypothetical protein